MSYYKVEENIENKQAFFICHICNDKTEYELDRPLDELTYEMIKDHCKEDNHRTLCKERRKEQQKQHQKTYYEKNKDEINDKKKQYFKDHPDKLTEKSQKYYEKHKDEIREKQKTKDKCPLCDSEVLKRHMKRHQRSKACIKND